MAQSVRDIVHNLYSAFAAGDAAAALALLHPRVVWVEAENAPYADRNPYIGPEAVAEGEQGWLKLGEPQAELGLGLAPFRTVEPKAGRLVLFPSTMWHGTIPFAAGERMTVAFDVARPQ